MNASEPARRSAAAVQCALEHEVLLRTFQDFRLEQALTDLREDMVWDLRAAAAFLTDRLTSHAPREEGLFRPGTAEHESAALEHGLLRAETAAFIAEISTLGGGSRRPSEAQRHRLLRRIHRIELLISTHAEIARLRTPTWGHEN